MANVAKPTRDQAKNNNNQAKKFNPVVDVALLNPCRVALSRVLCPSPATFPWPFPHRHQVLFTCSKARGLLT
ncbi:hypothetical protein COLO4_36205 [Corchorus olitorius]|uniref:Uncharacterized protein n=1 Tax=Corchorus olitorius TaxID=93759 RepID=A0A1R3GAJ0_9ROSI|nr:hypothetical protein COLO4_36205 [Corchorus olitorius]